MTFKQYLTEKLGDHKAYVFDVDDTLLYTAAKVLVMRDGKPVKALLPKQFNTNVLMPGEKYDFSQFDSPEILHKTARKGKVWKSAQNINDAIKRGESDSTLYILTARGTKLKPFLFGLLKQMGLSTLKITHVYTVGDRAHSGLTIAQLKKQTLARIKRDHPEVHFFDDDRKNIELARDVEGITARKVNNHPKKEKKDKFLDTVLPKPTSISNDVKQFNN